MVWNGLWILMCVRDVSAMILARITPVLIKHNVLLTFITIHRQARQNTEEYADQQTKLESAPSLQLVMGTVFRNASQMQTVLEMPSVVSVAVCLLV